MLRDPRLVEDNGAFRRNTGGDQAGRHLARALPQLSRVLRHGNGVQVHNTIDRFKTVLQRHPVADRPQIIAKMQIAGWLNTGKDAPARVARRHGA